MSASHQSAARRNEVVRAATEVLERRRDGHLPWDVDGVTEVFDHPDDLLLALFQRWHVALLARLDAVIEDLPSDSRTAVLAATSELAWERPGLAALLDTHADVPALAAARRRHAELVGLAAGGDVSRELAQLRLLPRRDTTARPARRAASWTARVRRFAPCHAAGTVR